MSVKFDREEVIEKATALFWEKGFHATSMRDLQQAVDLRPGSIYASFGGKEALFSEALQHYARFSLDSIAACRAETGTPLAALRALLARTLESRGTAPSGMCMLVKSVAELTDETPQLKAEARRLLNLVEEAFAELIQEAVDAGEIPERKSATRLARIFQMQMFGLRTYAAAHDGPLDTAELVEDALSFLR